MTATNWNLRQDGDYLYIERVNITFLPNSRKTVIVLKVPHITGFLMQFSEKAKHEGEAYALRTAAKAAASVERQPYREISTPRPA